MDTVKTYTSGQVAGLTQINPMQLYRYVRDFGEFFSEGARKHTRGRRWTLADVEIILSIRALYLSRSGKDGTRELLAGGWRLEKSEFYSREAMETLFESAQIFAEEAKQTRHDLDIQLNEIRYWSKIAKETFEAVKKDHERFIQVYTEFQTAKVASKKKGLFGR